MQRRVVNLDGILDLGDFPIPVIIRRSVPKQADLPLQIMALPIDKLYFFLCQLILLFLQLQQHLLGVHFFCKPGAVYGVHFTHKQEQAAKSGVAPAYHIQGSRIFHVCLLGRDAQYHHDRYYHHGKYQRASHIDVVPLPVGKLADAAEIACGKDGGIHRNVSQGRYIRRFLFRGVLKKQENLPSAKYEMLNCVCTYRAVSAVPYGNITAEKHKRRYICHRKQQRNTANSGRPIAQHQAECAAKEKSQPESPPFFQRHHENSGVDDQLQRHIDLNIHRKEKVFHRPPLP